MKQNENRISLISETAISDLLSSNAIPIRVPIQTILTPTIPINHSTPLPTTSSPLQHHQGSINKSDNTSDDTVRNLAASRVSSKSQTQPAVDDTEHEQRAAEPDVDMGDWGPGGGFAILKVVGDAEEGLKEEEDEDDCAEDGVGLDVRL